MRKRFEQQLKIGQIPISEVKINIKCRDEFPALLKALQELFVNKELNEKIFAILEEKIFSENNSTGRRGMDLWLIFVLAQARLCLNEDYDGLHDLANNHRALRQIMGIETNDEFTRIEFEYQTIKDNVNLLDDKTVRELNEVIVEFGHGVFKKKETEASNLKTDSFVVETTVHFPTDYNLLYDCGRKCIDIVIKLLERHEGIKGWRKVSNWKNELKNLMRTLGQAQKNGGKNKEIRVKEVAEKYLEKAKLLSQKISNEGNFPILEIQDLALQIELENHQKLLNKHIDLVDRRIIKGEEIPHSEKIFSIFEQYTEWITKGKLHPNVELGKNVQITTDQYHLIIDYQIYENEVDKNTVINLADRLLLKYKIQSWSFDRGFYKKENKDLLKLFILELIMPKKGKLNQKEKEEEYAPKFKKMKKKHSAVESNINELEFKGLDRCPDKGFNHFKRYIGLGVCAYNLHRIGKELIKRERESIQKQKAA